MAQIVMKKGLESNLDKVAKVEGQLLFTTDSKRIFLDTSSTERLELYGDIETIVEKLNGEDSNADSVKGLIKAAKEALIGTDSDTAESVTIKGAHKAAAAAKTEAEAKVASVGALSTDGSVNVDNTDSKNPKLGINLHTATEDEAANMLSKQADGLYVPTPAAADTYEIKAKDDAGTYAAVYQLIKKTNGAGEGVAVGVDINIPKDFLVKSGSVVEVSAEQKGTEGFPADAGTYIKMIINAKDASATEEVLWINVGSLIEYVTSGSQSTDMVVVDVSSDHKVTATITDSTVTKEKLVTAVQTSLGLADNSMQKPATTVANNLVTFSDTTGTAADSGKAIGGATLAATPNADTVATEAAVKAAVNEALEWGTFANA